METYDSKVAIYTAGYDIAFKFVLDDICIRPSDYDRFRDELKQLCQVTLMPFSQSVKNWETQGLTSVSVGYFIDFVDAYLQDSGGEQNNVRMILLQHEDGAEIFLMANVGGLADLLTVASAFWKVVTFMKNQWPNLFQIERKPARIRWVEIRTATKGVMQLPLEQFKKDQIECLIRKFPEIDRLSDCNVECFAGCLKTLPTSSGG